MFEFDIDVYERLLDFMPNIEVHVDEMIIDHTDVFPKKLNLRVVTDLKYGVYVYS